MPLARRLLSFLALYRLARGRGRSPLVAARSAWFCVRRYGRYC